MNATKAKELLLPIPKEKFITNDFSDNRGKCCAVGHLVRLTSKNPNSYAWDNCIDREDNDEVTTFVRETVTEFNLKYHNQKESLAGVNNYPSVNGYNQDNPKDRVIALLDDMIKEGL